MKIVAITDKKGSAIDRLARMNEKRLAHMGYTVLPVHPKRATPQELEHARQVLEGATIIDAQYWKSATMLRLKFPELFKDIPVVLTHHNEHNINDTAKDHWNWKDFEWSAHVAKNGWQREELKKQGIDARIIRHSLEWDNFKYTEKLPEEKVVGYVGQVKKVKGVKFIAQACKELGYQLMLVGSISEAGYWEELMKEFEGTIATFYPGSLMVNDEAIGSAYERMSCYCANSDDGTESGTMPILEAMASGIPVVTRRFGLVRDCGEHQKNMWVRTGRYDDVEDLKAALKMVVENRDIADKLRDNAWRTVRQYHPDVQAREYEKLFRAVLHPNQTPVSIIMPTCGRNEALQKNIETVARQWYKNIELVICDDNRHVESVELVGWLNENRQRFNFPIKRVWTLKLNDAYQLAKARNLGIIEATGDIVVFCDDRLHMHPNAVEAFVNSLKKYDKNKKVWLWGSKGVFKTFVENFSATWRRSIIDAGMFNERIDCYGGMTQEVSGRFNAQGFKFDFCPQAVAEPAFGTHSKSKNRNEIVISKIKLYKMGFQ